MHEDKTPHCHDRRPPGLPALSFQSAHANACRPMPAHANPCRRCRAPCVLRLMPCVSCPCPMPFVPWHALMPWAMAPCQPHAMPCVPGLMPCRAHRVYFFRMTRPHATPKRRAANGTPRECRSSGRPCAEPAGLHCRDGRSPVPSRGRPCAERQSPVPNPRRSSSLHFFPQRGSTGNRDKMPLPTFAWGVNAPCLGGQHALWPFTARSIDRAVPRVVGKTAITSKTR